MHRADHSAFAEDADPASVLAAVLGEAELREALEETDWEEDDDGEGFAPPRATRRARG